MVVVKGMALTMQQSTATDLIRIMGCNGSRLMSASPTTSDGKTSSREEGIAAHHMAVAVFSGKHSDTSELVDRLAPNGVYMSADMAEHVDEYLDVGRANPRAHTVLMEHETYLTDHRTFEVKGRADRIIWDGDTLIIDDFKYGWRLVEPDMNWTLIFHAVAYCVAEQINPPYVIFRICQPRPHHQNGSYRIWSIDHAELLALYHQLIGSLAALSDVLQTGSWCTNCPVMPTCPARRAAEYNCIEASEQAFDDAIDNATLTARLDMVTRAKLVLTEQEKALAELARYRLKSGQIIENYALNISYGNRAWNDGIDAETLRIITGKDLSKPGLITPAQAVKKGVPEETVNAFTSRSETGVKLVRESADKKAKRLLGGKV